MGEVEAVDALSLSQQSSLESDLYLRQSLLLVHPDERGETCARFLVRAAGFFAELGVRVERVMTDRALCYTGSVAFAEALGAIGARHRPTRPYRPQENGKAERFIGTMLQE